MHIGFPLKLPIGFLHLATGQESKWHTRLVLTRLVQVLGLRLTNEDSPLHC
jgi:hypothetical protein